MNDIHLEICRPKIRNALWACGFLLLTAGSAVVFAFTVAGTPTAFNEKLLSCVSFTLAWLGMLFLGTAAVNCIRNIFSKPTVVLTNETLSVFGQGELKVCDITESKIQTQKKSVTFTDINGTTVLVRQRMVSIPVETLVYAVELRKKEHSQSDTRSTQ